MSVRTAKPCLKPAFFVTLKKKRVKQPTPLQKEEGLVVVFGFSGVVYFGFSGLVVPCNKDRNTAVELTDAFAG